LLEPRTLFSFTPYISDGLSATPNYEFVNTRTDVTQTVAPLGATSPSGAPLIPATMRNAYGLGSYTYSNGVYTYNYGVSFNGIKGDGTGQTIAIVDVGSDPDIATDLATFDSYYNLPAPPSFQQLSQTGSSTNLPAVDPGWPGEISLDVEWSHVMAPGANIILFAASDLYAAVQEAASYPGVSVVSMSFTVSGNAPDSDFLTPSGHTGVSFFAGNGDTGSEVPSPAQSTNVVAVGGTTLSVNGSGGYGSESAWSAGGGGISTSESQPAYQSGIVSAYSTTQRTTPDVSMDADPGSGVAIVDSYDSGSAAPWELIIGGTSLATPLFAGVVAVADQGRVDAGLTAMDGSTQLLPRLYELSQANYSLNYHDVTTGNNGHPATSGYDLATGLGSAEANNLIPDLAGDDTVSGQAFIDVNGNGTYDPGVDTVLANKAVYLDLNNSGAQTAQDPTTTTSSTGTYTFSDVVGSAKAVVRLVGTTGQINQNTTVATTAYDTSQTYNIAIGSQTTYTATAFPASTTLKSSLSVTLNGSAPSGLTYTWSAATEPSGASPVFSVNGTAGAQNTTVTFNKAGTYLMVAKVTNAAGQSATTTVTVTVTQVLTSVSVNALPAAVTAGQSVQLSASGYDQFGTLISSSVVANWSVVSGGGVITPTGGIYTAPAVGTLATVQASIGTNSSTGTVGVIGIPWTAVDIGNPGNDGQAYDSGTTTTISEASDDIWNQSDDFLFDYQELDSQNITFTAELNSQVSASSYIKAGLMIRNSLSSSDEMAMVCAPAPGAIFEFRNSSGGTAAQDVGSAVNTPCYLQIVRNGSTFTGLISTNDVTWTTLGSVTIAMGADVYVGLALSSHNASDLATATFSNQSISSGQVLTSASLRNFPVNLTTGQSLQLAAVGYDQNGFPMSTQPTFTWALNSGGGSISSAGVYTTPSTGTDAGITATATGLPALSGNIGVVNSPWGASDVGTVAIPGIAYNNSNATVSLTEGSDDIWNQSDDFLFDYQALNGNGSITAELNSQTSASTYIKAGLMIRNSLASDDVMAMVADPSAGPLFEWRTTVGGTAAQDATSIANNPPYWLRLVRSGSTFIGYYSPNGTSWTEIGSQTISMSGTVYIGLALSSHNAADSATAVFSNITINNPTVATAASASPNPVTGKTAALSVLGANTTNPGGESTLTYTWAATSIPAGATAPTFSANGANAAKNITVTFSKAGNYTFTVTIFDPLGESVTSIVPVTVSQTVTSIAVTPATVSLNTGASQTFTAVANDQFGTALATQPVFTWSRTSGVGSINASTGVYIAGATPGSAVITAASGSISGSASITVNSTGPTITTAAAASPSPVDGTTTTLSVTASDPAGVSSLTYTWAATGTPPAGVTFSANSNNSAATTVATFSEAGSYSFQVTVTDSSGLTATSTVNVVVNQAATSVSLSSPTIAPGKTTQATAYDQFGNPFTAPPTWTATGGSISTTGLFTAGTAGGSYLITATAGGASAQATVDVVPIVYTGTTGNDTYAIRISPTSRLIEQIFVNTPESATPTYTIQTSKLSSLTFNTASDGSLTVDFANGNPIPSGGINYTGGNELYLEGAGTGLMAFSIDSNQVADTAVPSSPISYSNVANIEFDLAGGSNTLTQTAQPLATVTFNAGPLSNTLNVSGGTFTFSADPQFASGNLTVNDNASVVFTAPAPGSGYNARNLAALNLGTNATATVTASPTATDRTVLEVNQLSIASGATLDLGNNAMIVHNGNLNSLTSLLASGYDGGQWNGTGIDSSSAASDSTSLTALGVISNSLNGAAIYSTFDNQPAVSGDVLIKYTYYGDTNLDGQVDGSDYSRIDAAFLADQTNAQSASGWFNGDLNYDGNVDGSDYTLMDNAFNAQGAQLAASIASPDAVVAAPGLLGASAAQISGPIASGKTAGLNQTSAPLPGVFTTGSPIRFPADAQSIELLMQKKDLLDLLAGVSGIIGPLAGLV
jgi:hypothetical protein